MGRYKLNSAGEWVRVEPAAKPPAEPEQSRSPEPCLLSDLAKHDGQYQYALRHIIGVELFLVIIILVFIFYVHHLIVDVGARIEAAAELFRVHI